jgi:transcriptional antiterminator NusG
VTDESNNASPLPSEVPPGPAAEGVSAAESNPPADASTRGNEPAGAVEAVAADGQGLAASGELAEKVETQSDPEPVVEELPPVEGLSAAPQVEPAAEEPATLKVTSRAAPKSKPARAKKAVAVKEEEVQPAGPKSDKMDWYILKVQSNREDSIREGLQRRVRIAGLDSFFGDVIVPIEMVTEFKGGKKRVVKRKLYPGYLVVQMEINEDTWFLVRETPGIGDFTGASGRPSPMLPHEIAKIIARQEEKSEDAPKLKINFNTGDHVKINDGTFENFEGEVEAIDQQNGRVTVMINIFGRSTPVELEYWQIEAV